MKQILRLMGCMLLAGIPLCLGAQTPTFDSRLQETILTKGSDTYLITPDKYGTPLILQLARRGDTQTILQAAQHTRSGAFLLAKDKYGNNILHVAKDAATIQLLASLLRHYYGAQAPDQLRTLADAPNQWGETPLYAQITAGHTDTFRPIYAQTSLKITNDLTQNQRVRLYGMDERIIAQQTTIYCRNIQQLSSSHGQTLLQIAQSMAASQPKFNTLVQEIRRELPCLTETVN